MDQPAFVRGVSDHAYLQWQVQSLRAAGYSRKQAADLGKQQLERRRERVAANLPEEGNEPLVLPEGKGERAAPYVAKAIVRHTPTKSHPVHRLPPKAGQFFQNSTAHRNEEVAKRFREEAERKERAPKAQLQHAPLPKASSSKSSGSSAQVPAFALPTAKQVPGIAPLASKSPPVKKEEVKQETKEEEFEEEPDWSPGEGVFEAAELLSQFTPLHCRWPSPTAADHRRQ